MTVTSMVDTLIIRLGSVSEKPLSRANILSYLNTAQLRFLTLINRNLVGVLDQTDSDLSLTDNGSIIPSSYDITGLTKTPYGGPGGIDVIRINNGGNYMSRISFDEYQDHINGRATSASGYVYYVRGDKLYFVGYDGKIDIDYMRKPDTLVESGASSGETVTCEMNEVYHEIIMDIAEAEGWRTLWDRAKEQEATSRATSWITHYNSQFLPTETRNSYEYSAPDIGFTSNTAFKP